MLRITCPWCGPRDEAEFTYRGDASVTRPAGELDDAAAMEAFTAYVYLRENPRGWHLEWWQHSAACRQWLKLRRHTVTHEIAAVLRADEDVSE